jgi:hypothetical protein
VEEYHHALQNDRDERKVFDFKTMRWEGARNLTARK